MEKLNLLEEEVLKSRDFAKRGEDGKDFARRNDNNIDLYRVAASYYKQASESLDFILDNIEETKINAIARASALREYYLFESFECEYSYFNKNNQYDLAIENSTQAMHHIKKALSIIEEKLPGVNENEKEFLNEMKINWQLCSKTILIRIIEPNAKKAIDLEDYITALDIYREMDRLHDSVFKYITDAPLKEIYRRIQSGNYFSSKASIATSIAGVFIKKTDADYTLEILEQFLKTISFLKNAQEINPEWPKYKEGIDTAKSNIKRLLLKNKDSWDNIYFNFESDNQLIAIMKETDLNNFKQIELRNKLDDPFLKAKKIAIFGGLWLSILLTLFGCVALLFLLKLHWSLCILVVLLVQFLYALVSATILRSIGDLSEENMLEIYKLTIRLNFNLFKKAKPEMIKTPEKET